MRLIVIMLTVVACADAFADDGEELNGIYRAFMTAAVDIEHIATLYHDDVIHVSRKDAPLQRGIGEFMATNVVPMADAINAGEVNFKGKAYIVRRVIVGNMANDVGYLHSAVTFPDGRAAEQLQKFSWVFVKEDGRWRVLTDFDGVSAPPELLEELEPEFVIE